MAAARLHIIEAARLHVIEAAWQKSEKFKWVCVWGQFLGTAVVL